MLKERMIGTYVFAACLLCQVLLPLTSSGQKSDVLYAVKTGDKVQLYWDCRSWAPDQKGYMLMRSPAGKGLWTPLSSVPVIPSIDSIKDYNPQGITDEAALDTLRRTYKHYLLNGTIVPLNAEEMRMILKEHNGLGAGDRIKMKKDFMLALIMGFACIDLLDNPDDSYDYALFAVRMDGTRGQHPLDTFRLGEISPLAFEVRFRTNKESVVLEWELPVEIAKAGSTIGFYAERTLTDGSSRTVVTAQPIGSVGTDTGLTRRFKLFDYGADPLTDYRYYLMPVNVFGQKGDAVTAEFLADQYRKISLPVISMIQLVEETDMLVTWDINPEDAYLIKGFLVEWSKEMSGDHTVIVSDTLGAATREFIDKTPKKYSEVYYYRITAIGNYGQVVTSAPEATYYMGLASPPEVTGLRSMTVKKDGKMFINLVWTPKGSADTITRGFVLYSDELIPDSFLQITSLPVITGNQTLYPVNTQGGRKYRFRVAGVSDQGKTGKPAETIIEIGTLHLPKVTRIASELLDDENLLIKWHYQNYADLKGFRVLVNGKELASPKEITGDMRSYLIPNLPEADKGELRVSLVAVGSETESELGFQHTVYLNNSRKSAGNAPQKLTFEWIKKEHPEMIQLCWEPPFNAGNDLAGYALFNDYAGNGRLYRINTIPVIKETSYSYIQEQNNRSSITIGVAAVYKNGQTGRVSSITIPFKNQEFNNNQQR